MLGDGKFTNYYIPNYQAWQNSISQRKHKNIPHFTDIPYRNGDIDILHKPL